MALSKKAKKAVAKIECPDKDDLRCEGCRAGASCLAG
jgi:hypothetical protein